MTIKSESCKTCTLLPSRPRPVDNSDVHASAEVKSPLRNSNNSRITSSSLAIAWSIIILVFFTFFNHYIAYYEPQTVDGVSRWVRYPILTTAFASWLPVLVATVFLFVIGHIILIYFEKYVVQETTIAVLNLFAIATALSLLCIFPFDFTAIPDVELGAILHMFARVLLLGIIVTLGVGTLVRLIRLVASISLRKA